MRIAIIGHFGGKEHFTDGQTVKVKSLYIGLQKELQGNVKIDKVDTYLIKHNKLKLVLSLLKCILIDKIIIFLPATNGRKVLFCLMHYLQVIFNKKIYHDCIGGALAKELADHPEWNNYLNGFEENWMESQIQVDKLVELGIKNAVYVPNFKNIKPLSKNELEKSFNIPFEFCTFSRVLPEKGIEDAINAVEHVNDKFGMVCATLDIYGPIQNGNEKWFDELLRNHSDAVTYKGIVDSNNSVSVLKKYYALLFPTRYYTEGMPGTIIDAMFSGVPVIARKWAYCDQMINSGVNGISYSFDNPNYLEHILEEIIKNPECVIKMRENCLNEAEKYTEKYVVGKIIDAMGLR